MDGTCNSGNLRFWKMSESHFFKFPQNELGFENAPSWCFKVLQKIGLGKSSNSQNPNLHFQPPIQIFDTHGKMDLEKLITMNPI